MIALCTSSYLFKTKDQQLLMPMIFHIYTWPQVYATFLQCTVIDCAVTSHKLMNKGMLCLQRLCGLSILLSIIRTNYYTVYYISWF